MCGGLRELDVDLSRTDLFLTHLHGDHSGLVGLFPAAGCPVYMNEIDYTYLCDEHAGQAWQFIEDTYMKEGMPPEDIKSQFTNQARRYSPRIDFPIHAVADGDVVRLADIDFHVIHTPGHTKGICCLYLPEQEIFFTSDHILFDITPNIQVAQHERFPGSLSGKPGKGAEPAGQAGPAGTPRKGNTSIVGRIDEIKEHHRRRLNEVLSIAAAQPGSTAYDIAPPYDLVHARQEVA